MSQLVCLREGRQYYDACNVNNEDSGRNRSKMGHIPGSCPQERIKSWFNHFKDPLGFVPNDSMEADISPVITGLNKTSLTKSKNLGPDCIPEEVFKNCNSNGIVLNFFNRALVEGENPDLWSP